MESAEFFLHLLLLRHLTFRDLYHLGRVQPLKNQSRIQPNHQRHRRLHPLHRLLCCEVSNQSSAQGASAEESRGKTRSIFKRFLCDRFYISGHPVGRHFSRQFRLFRLVILNKDHSSHGHQRTNLLQTNRPQTNHPSGKIFTHFVHDSILYFHLRVSLRHHRFTLSLLGWFL
jgi:hypothetical protein